MTDLTAICSHGSIRYLDTQLKGAPTGVLFLMLLNAGLCFSEEDLQFYTGYSRPTLHSALRSLVENRTHPVITRNETGQYHLAVELCALPFLERMRRAVEWLQQDASIGHIYVVECRGRYKIGRTSLRPRIRLRAFQTANPDQVRTIALIPTRFPAQQERELHQQFADRRLRGEWFALTVEDLAYIQGLERAAQERFGESVNDPQ